MNNYQIFDVDDVLRLSHNTKFPCLPLEMTASEVSQIIDKREVKISSRYFFIQRMGLMEDGETMGYYEMYDASYPPRLQKTMEQMKEWFRVKELVFVKSDMFESVCHAMIIEKVVHQIESLLAFTIVPEDPLMTDEYKNFLSLANNYFFSLDGNGSKFLRKLEK